MHTGKDQIIPEPKTEKVEVEKVERGTFAGTEEELREVIKGEPKAADTGDQGGGQN